MLKIEEILELDINKLEKPKRPLVLYGTGIVGNSLYNTYLELGFDVLAVCDSDEKKWGTKFYDYNIMSFGQVLEEFQNFQVAITVGREYYDEVLEIVLQHLKDEDVYLENKLIHRDSTISMQYRDMVQSRQKELINFYNVLSDEFSKEVLINVLKGNVTDDIKYFTSVSTPNQYFNELTASEYEKCFIDGGAYDGDTIEDFIAFSNGQFGQILAFEPLDECYSDLKQRIDKKNEKDRINIYNKGLYDCSGSIGFNNEARPGSTCIDDDSFERIQVISLDEMNIKDVSFIKMDIEGSELKALIGATEIIKKNKPKLAICLYHKVDDILDISNYIRSIGVKYNYAIRHHGGIHHFHECETVLYAIPIE